MCKTVTETLRLLLGHAPHHDLGMCECVCACAYVCVCACVRVRAEDEDCVGVRAEESMRVTCASQSMWTLGVERERESKHHNHQREI